MGIKRPKLDGEERLDIHRQLFNPATGYDLFDEIEVHAQTLVQQRTSVNLSDFLVGRTFSEACDAAIAELKRRSGCELIIPPFAFVADAPVVVEDIDLVITGSAGTAHSDGVASGASITAGDGVPNIFVIRGRPYQGNAAVRVGSFNVRSLSLRASSTGTNAAFRFEVGGGPMRPVGFWAVSCYGFQNAIDVSVAPGANTGIGSLTIGEHCTFSGGVNMLRGRGNNAIVSMAISNILAEQGARIDIEGPDGGPGAMGLIKLDGGIYEGQANFCRMAVGSAQIHILSPYLERNTGKTFDLKASTSNSSATIHRLNTEHTPLDVRLQGFGEVEVKTYSPKISLRVAYNGAKSRYTGVPVIPLLDSGGTGTCLSLADASDSASYGRSGQPGATYSGSDFPDAPYPDTSLTPYGPLPARTLGVGIGTYSYATGALTPTDMAVVTALVRRRAGFPRLGYVLLNATSGAVLSNRAGLVEVEDMWSVVMFAFTPADNVPNIKIAWQVTNGIYETIVNGEAVQNTATGSEIQVTAMWCSVVPAGTGIHHWRPRMQVVPQTAPAALGASPTAADYNALVAQLQAAGVLK